MLRNGEVTTMTDYNSEIGKWLAEKRRKRGMTQQEVADKMGHTRTAIHYWESGKRTIYADAFLEYCKVIDANPSELVEKLIGKKQ